MFWILFGYIVGGIILLTAIREFKKYFKEGKATDGINEIAVMMLIAATVLSLFLVNAGTISYWDSYDTMQEFKEYREMVVTNDNVYYDQEKVSEYNEWLSEAKAGLDTYGMFSTKPKEIEELDYIRIPE